MDYGNLSGPHTKFNISFVMAPIIEARIMFQNASNHVYERNLQFPLPVLTMRMIPGRLVSFYPVSLYVISF